MIEKRTVFVLGAGASCPYRFPTARGLRREIIQAFVADYEKLLDERARPGTDGINDGYPAISSAKDFVDAFRDSSTESIDLFLSGNPRFEKVGKIAIVLSILGAEGWSAFREELETTKEVAQDWYWYLFNRLRRELTGRDGYQDFGGNRITFITFNYDRSLEHFLFDSLLHSFEGADAQTVRAQIDRIPIIHVYGKLAPLPWQEDDTSKVLGYGDHGLLSSRNVLGIIENLYVVREERVNPEQDKAREAIQEAERVFFLGFGYAPESLEALGLLDVLRRTPRIYGTAMRWNARELRDIRVNFVHMLQRSGNKSPDVGERVQIRDCDCVELLREFL